MSFIELKKVLASKIAETNDEDILITIYHLLDSSPEVYQLSQEETMAIQEARAEYKRGEFITNEELQKEFDKWLIKSE